MTRKQQDIVNCEKCGRGYWDNFNLICLAAFGLCLICANSDDQILEKVKAKYER